MRTYTFTQAQLYKILTETIDLRAEYLEVHGYNDSQATHQAAAGTIEGLDAEAELIAEGEKITPTCTIRDM